MQQQNWQGQPGGLDFGGKDGEWLTDEAVTDEAVTDEELYGSSEPDNRRRGKACQS
jgi:hypothetical protein